MTPPEKSLIYLSYGHLWTVIKMKFNNKIYTAVRKLNINCDMTYYYRKAMK